MISLTEMTNHKNDENLWYLIKELKQINKNHQHQDIILENIRLKEELQKKDKKIQKSVEIQTDQEFF